jgi:hypothetical protein
LPKDFSNISDILKPCGRLFLSVDLVGSTAHKQNTSFPLSVDDPSWPEGELSPPWLSSISDFFAQFGRVFNEGWDEYCEYAKNKSLPSGSAPQLWKANGDELIYVKELNDRRELYGCLDAWIRSLRSYRSELQKHGSLDVKGTCWFAGFPITNSEIVFQQNVGLDDDNFADDPRLRQLYLREKWHQSSTGDSTLIRDFIGPSIDIGFRLTGLASPRKMIISLDVAYFIATAHLPSGSPSERRLEWFNTVYDGRKPLKGVLNGKPYPVFWIDVTKDEPLAQAEDKLLNHIKYCSEKEIMEFCENFFVEHRGSMLKPFLINEPDEQYGIIPENYFEFLEYLQDRWQSEKERYENEMAENSPDQEEGEKLSSAEMKDIARKSARKDS